MRELVVLAAVVLSGCGGKGVDGKASAAAASGGVVHQQPGSWTSKMEITRLDVGGGVDTAKMREGMQTMLDASSARSLCITPEYAAKFDAQANMERVASQGKNCTFDRRDASGSKVDLSGVCSDANGNKLRLTVSGTNAATTQDMIVHAEPADASAPLRLNMDMHITSRRTGDCKPGDLTPPVPGAAAAS